MSRFYLLIILVFSACSHGTFYVPPGKDVYEPTDASSIAITSQKEIDRKHVVIGRVAVISWGDGETARAELQKQAAKLGANAITEMQVEKGFMRTAASGTAILVFR